MDHLPPRFRLWTPVVRSRSPIAHFRLGQVEAVSRKQYLEAMCT